MASELENWSLEKWLKRLGLRKYKQAFLDNGYDTPDLCANLQKEDLDAIGVSNKHHRSTLFTQARKLLEVVDKESFLASEEIVDEPTEKKNGDHSPQLSSGSGRTPPPPTTPPPPSMLPPPSSAVQPPPLPDYSEPWNSKALPACSAASTQPLKKLTISTSSSIDTMDGPSPVHRKVSGQAATLGSANRKKAPLSPGAPELPTYKREGSAGMTRTRLQLKLKIREELFLRGVVLTEPPYCWEDGAPDEQEVMDLAAELAEKFSVESLDMFDALKEVWSNANKSDFTAKRKAKAQVAPKEPTGNYDEPFDTLQSNTPTSPNPPTQVGKQSPTIKSSPQKQKAFTLPALQDTPNGNYDEPFDTVAASPEKRKVVRVESSQTLPSPSRQRRLEDSSGDHSPSRGKNSRFGRLFRRKEKARSHSVRESDLKMHGFSAPVDVKHMSAENLPDMASADQITYLVRGVPPPVPSPRPQQGVSSESSEDSEKNTPTMKTKKYGGKKFRKFITPPTLQRNQVEHFDDSSFSSGGSAESDRIKSGVIMEGMKGARSTIGFHRSSKGMDEEYEGKAWLRTSKSFDQLNTIASKQEPETVAKKSRKRKLISRLFKRKSGPKGKSTKDSNRDSVVSNVSSHASEMSRERSLTASMSLPDISNLVNKQSRKHSATPSNDGYAEVFDAIKPAPDVSRYSPPQANTFHRGPVTEKRDDYKSGEKQNVPSKPPRVSHTSPQQSSPVDISPPPAHQKIFIRGSSDSSGPDNITINLNLNAVTTRGSEVTKDAGSALGEIGSRSGAASVESAKMSDSEDVASLHMGTSVGSEASIKRVGSAGSETLEAPIRRVESAGASTLQTNIKRVGSAGSDTLQAPIRRAGSAGSNTSHQTSPSESLPRKPPTLPKPHILGAKSKPSPARKGESAALSKSPTTAVTVPPPAITTSKPAKPPPKPARGLSQKVKGATPTNTSKEDTATLVSPSRVAPVPKGRVSPRPERNTSPRPLRSSAPGGAPPPKPARIASVRGPQSKSEGDSGLSSGKEVSATLVYTKGVTPQGTPPPPKPSRRGKSVKILDPSEENRSSTLSKSRQPPEVTKQDYAATLPHHFKVRGQQVVRSESPKPAPKPRMGGTMKTPEGNPRSSRTEK